MKKIILIISLIISGTCYAFDNCIQFPTAQMQSVNQMPSNVSYHSNITPVGAYSPSESSSNSIYNSKPRRVINDPNDPFATPIGEPLILLIFGIIYIFILIRKNMIRDLKNS